MVPHVRHNAQLIHSVFGGSCNLLFTGILEILIQVVLRLGETLCLSWTPNPPFP